MKINEEKNNETLTIVYMQCGFQKYASGTAHTMGLPASADLQSVLE